jgi:1,4-dihydroxy-2-naphthoate octaprenyltransferase
MKILRLGRFHFPFIGILLFSFGALLALLSSAPFVFERLLFGCIILFTAQLSVSYSNDFYDVKVDQYSERTPFSGGSRILLENPEFRSLSKKIAIFLTCLSFFLALLFYILFTPSLLLLLIVLLGNLLGWCYTAPPLRLAYRGYSEATVLITVGFLLPGFGYYIMKEIFDSVFLVFLVPSLLYVLNLILSLESPDKEGDRQGGKNTIIVRKGREFGFILLAISCVLATLFFVAISLLRLMPRPIDSGVIVILSLIPLASAFWSFLNRREKTEKAMKLNLYNVVALIIFVLAIDCYFIFLLA